MSENDVTQEISLILGPALFLLYLWMAKSIIRAAKITEDKTAEKRFRSIFLTNGAMVAIFIIFTAYVVLTTNRNNLSQLPHMDEVAKQLSMALCIGTLSSFGLTFLWFWKFTPWFWKNRSIFPPYDLDNKKE